MSRQVVIIHGWSDHGNSFQPLASFVNALDRETRNIWLADYISLEDDVRVEDVAKRLQAVFEELLQNGTLERPFDLIVHSTGGLVAREWITTYYSGDKISECPVKRLIMLAPANFGSKLATMGQSLIGRVLKGWNNWFKTGKLMLDDLELGSLYQWQLAERDIFKKHPDDISPYGQNGVWPFVIVGSHPYLGHLREIVNENGCDGTVRVAAANLNAKGTTLNFATKDEQPIASEWETRHDPAFQIPFAVLADRTHSSITNPQATEPSSPRHDELAAVLGEALSCDWDTYEKLAQQWKDQYTEKTALLCNQDMAAFLFSRQDANSDYFHQFFMINVHVTDDHGRDIPDYFLEFYGPEDEDDDATIYFHQEVLTHVHINQYNPAYRTLYINRNKLMDGYYQRIKDGDKSLKMSISVKPPGSNISYFSDHSQGAKGSFLFHTETETDIASRWLNRNSTHFVRIIIPRCPEFDVCKLTAANNS